MIEELKALFHRSKPFSDMVIPFTAASLLFLALFLLAATATQFRLASTLYPGQYSSFSVEGVGKASAESNVASFSFSISEQQPTVAEAKNVAQEKMAKVMELLKREGVEEKDVKTLSYNINPIYDYTSQPCTINFCPPGEQVLRGYVVDQSVSVKSQKVEAIEKLISGVADLKVSYVSGLTFTVEDEDVLKEEARENAVKDAQQKAAKLAQDLGVKLVRVTSFYENSEPMPMYGYGEYDMYSMNSAPKIDLPAGQTEVESRVSITYEIR